MNDVLVAVCFFFLLVILALPLGLIVSQLFADAARLRRHRALPSNAAPREPHSIYF